MSKYIKIEDLKWHSPDESIAEPLTEFYVTESDIADLPAIDIVHCGECKCCRDELIEEHMPLYIYCEKWNHETDFDGFCSAGERIDE